MNRASRFIKHLAHAILLAAVWLLAACPALAESPKPSGSGGGGDSMDYMLSYMVVALAIVLAMLVVGRASNRRERETPGGYVEKNIMVDE